MKKYISAFILVTGLFSIDNLEASVKKKVSTADSLYAVYDYAPDFQDSIIQKRIDELNPEIKIVLNKEVRRFIDYFTLERRDYMRLMLQRQSAYFPIFEECLAKDSIPDQLKYLTIVESGINPNALSPAGALGLWQFMPSTGRMFGLNGDWYIDERCDPWKSSVAAAKYLKQLHKTFDDWELALAAYNCGPGNVRRAIRRSGGKETFWEIYNYLPRETRSYVPQFMAVSYAMNYADEHNLFVGDDELEFFPETKTITVNQYFNVEAFSKELNVCLEDLLYINPEIKRNVVPTHVSNYTLRIPANSYEYFLQNESSLLAAALSKGPERLTYAPVYSASSSTEGKNKIVYTVRSGDVLGTIASRYGVKTSDLRTWNGINGDMIRVGQKLYIYKNSSYFKSNPPPTKTASKTVTPSSIPSGKIYTVQPGDTLWGISQKFQGVSVDDIKRLNNLQGSALKPGQKLKLG